MNKLKSYLVATACLIILVGVLTLVGSPIVQQGQAVQPTQDVTVVNTLENRVPVQGNVTVVNTPENPVPVVVHNGDMNGTTRQLVEFFERNLNQAELDFFTVPTGQRLVITDVIITAFGGVSANLQILRDGTVVSIATMPIGLYQQSYASGIEFTEGQTLTIKNPNAFNTNWELRGFLETLPPSP